MDQKKVTPRPGLQIPRADGNGNLPAEGLVVTMNSYYWSLKHDDDVTLTDVPAVTPASADQAGPPRHGMTSASKAKK